MDLMGHCEEPFDFAALRSGQAPRRSNLVNLASLQGDCFALLLRNKISGSDRLGEEREAQSCRSTLEVTDRPVTEVLFIGLLTLRLIGSAIFEHMIEHTRQLMCRGRDRVRGPFTRSQPAVITAQGRLRAPQRLRRQAQ